MKTYQIRWSYALNVRDEHGNATHPHRSGGECEYEGDTSDAAMEAFMADFTVIPRIQPFDASLLEGYAFEMLSRFRRGEIVAALQTLTDDELDDLVDEVRVSKQAVSQ